MKPTKPERSFIIQNIGNGVKLSPRKVRFKRGSIKPTTSISVLKSLKPLNSSNADVNPNKEQVK